MHFTDLFRIFLVKCRHTQWDIAGLPEDTNEPERLFLCLMYLLHSVDSVASRRDLLLGVSGGGRSALVDVQCAIARTNDRRLASCASRTCRNGQLAGVLGGPAGLRAGGTLEGCVAESVDRLSSLLGEDGAGGADGGIAVLRCLTSLSHLVSLLFPEPWVGPGGRGAGGAEDDVAAGDVKEGDVYWYDRGQDGPRTEAAVVRVHTDDFPNLYFTIREVGSDGERQTVASRLKRHSEPPEAAAAPSGTDEGDLREKIGRTILERIVKPYLSEPSAEGDDAARLRNEVAAECANVVISQCGLTSVVSYLPCDILRAF